MHRGQDGVLLLGGGTAALYAHNPHAHTTTTHTHTHTHTHLTSFPAILTRAVAPDTFPNLGLAELSPQRCPLRLWATVISTAVPGQAVVDVGSKGFAPCPPGPLPREWGGVCVEHPAAFMRQMSVEHGIVDIDGVDEEIRVGDVLSWIPTNAELTVALHDQAFAVRDGAVVEASLIIDPDATVREAHRHAVRVRHAVLSAVPDVAEVLDWHHSSRCERTACQ